MVNRSRHLEDIQSGTRSRRGVAHGLSENEALVPYDQNYDPQAEKKSVLLRYVCYVPKEELEFVSDWCVVRHLNRYLKPPLRSSSKGQSLDFYKFLAPWEWTDRRRKPVQLNLSNAAEVTRTPLLVLLLLLPMLLVAT